MANSYFILVSIAVALSLTAIVIGADFHAAYVRIAALTTIGYALVLVAQFNIQPSQNSTSTLWQELSTAALLVALGALLYLFLRTHLGANQYVFLMLLISLSILVHRCVLGINDVHTLASAQALAAGGSVCLYVSEFISHTTGFNFDDAHARRNFAFLAMHFAGFALLLGSTLYA